MNPRPLIAAIAVISSVALAACSGGDPTTGTETHWQRAEAYLDSCEVDSDCPGELECVLGMCSIGCGDTPECGSFEGAICHVPEEQVSDPPGVCTQSCSRDEDCHVYNDALSCEANVCLSSETIGGNGSNMATNSQSGNSANATPGENSTPNTATENTATNAATNNSTTMNAQPGNAGANQVMSPGGLVELTARPGARLMSNKAQVCEVVDDQDARCFGRAEVDEARWSQPAGAQLERVSMGPQGACGVDAEGALMCWAGAANVPDAASTQRWADVDVGGQMICALSMEQTVLCWGEAGVTKPLGAQKMRAIEIGDEVLCGVSVEGAVLCVDGAGASVGGPESGARFVNISASNEDTFCGVTTRDTVGCWGDGITAEIKEQLALIEDPLAVSISAGTGCAYSSKVSVCWGVEEVEKYSPEAGATILELEVAEAVACALIEPDALRCWGALASD